MMKVLKVARKNPSAGTLGFFIPLWRGGLCPRLATAYFSLSNHLQM